jgi:hypothetical protein
MRTGPGSVPCFSVVITTLVQNLGTTRYCLGEWEFYLAARLALPRHEVYSRRNDDRVP